MQIRIDEITIGDRYRKECGDLSDLISSITTVGLLQPVVITQDRRLIAGYRRIQAYRELKIDNIEAEVAYNVKDAYGLLRAQRDENTCRLDPPMSETVRIGMQLEEMEKIEAKKRQGMNFTCGKFPQVKRGRTRDNVGSAVGISGKTYEKGKQIVATNDASLIAIMDNGNVEKAWKEIKRREIRKQLDKTMELPGGKYRVLYADPPWKYNNNMPTSFVEQEDHYTVMTIEELCTMPISELAENNAVLFLWVTSPILEEAFQVIRAWGFKYKSSFVWDKQKHVMGHYNSVRHELLLICVRGSCQPDIHKLFDSVQSIPSTEHSEKPEEFRTIIDTIYPHGKRIELFARKQVSGWESFGNEIGGN